MPDPASDTAHRGHPLRLDSVSGPELSPFVLPPGTSATLGRALKSDLVLLDGSVSRVHATIADIGGRWMLTDAGSRHGTELNGARLTPNEPAMLRSMDLIRIGPWTLRARIGDGSGSAVLQAEAGSTVNASLATIVSGAERGEFVERLDGTKVGHVARQRLDLLLDYATRINTAPDELRLAEAVLDAALAGSGYGRAALLRTDGSTTEGGEPKCEVVDARMRDQSVVHAQQFRISGSLLAEAAQGEPARLGGGSAAMPDYGQSVSDLRIHSALCVPISVGERISAFLYLDARGSEASVSPDATGYCVALARLCGLAMANLVRRELEKRQKDLEEQLGAARKAQELIVPATEGNVGGLGYSLLMRPGLYVAGDLFDIIELDPAGGRVGVFLGDVTGEGIGAAILMASAQAQLHALLLDSADPALAANQANRYLAAHSPADRFLSLWVGVFDRGAQTVTYVDAGHGHWLHVPAGGEPTPIDRGGGIPIAITGDFRYEAVTVPFRDDDRLVLFSDGVVEQSRFGGGRSGEQFGLGRVIDIVRASPGPAEDTAGLLRAVLAFAGKEALDDDTTIASVRWSDGPAGPAGLHARTTDAAEPLDRPISPDSVTSG